MKKLTLALITISIFSCGNPGTETKAKVEQKDSIVPPIVIPAKIEFTKSDSENVASLEKKFLKITDDFNKFSWYSHRTWGKNWLNRKSVVAHVSERGYYYLESNYFSDDWLFHESIGIKIGDSVFSTQKVPSYSEDNKKDNESGDIWEVVRYMNEEIDFVEKIAKNYKSEIKIRFNGREFYDDITLSQKDKLAIKDCYELGLLLKKRRISQNS